MDMMMRARAGPEQFSVLLEFMERHGDISRPQKGIQGRVKAEILWRDLTKSLNSVGGGATKSIVKWKKVWIDWKAKTKKKALDYRRKALQDAGDGTCNRQILTPAEQRVLGIIGLNAVAALADVKERYGDHPLETNHEPKASTDSSTPAMEEVWLEYKLDPSTQLLHDATESTSASLPPSREMSPVPSSAIPKSRRSASPVRTYTHRAPPRPQGSPTPVPSTSRRLTILRTRRLRTQKPFQRATSGFIAIEKRRLQLEEDRERNHHEREMERLRLESRRIDIDNDRNAMLGRVADIVNNLVQILAQDTSVSAAKLDS